MNEQIIKKISTITSEMIRQDVSMRNAVEFVELCDKISEESILDILDSYILALEEASKSGNGEYIESIVHIINKGFKYFSEKNDAIKYYYYGYYSHIQEILVEKLSEYLIQDQIHQAVNTKHSKEILIYLFTKGVLRQKDLSELIKINKSNLARKIDKLIECKLICKQVGPKVVLYELTAKGYEYCRTNGLTRNQNELKMDERGIVFLRDNFMPVHPDENKIKKRMEEPWDIIEPVRQKSEFTRSYISKNTKKDKTYKVLYDIKFSE